MKRTLLRVNLGLVVALMLLYVGDTIASRMRKDKFSVVTVQHYYVIGQKNNKYEMQYDRDIDQPCATAIFPHRSYPPCWYLRRRTQKETKI